METSDIAKDMYSLYEKIRQYKHKNMQQLFKVNASSKKQISERQFLILLCIYHYNINTLTEIARVLNLSTGSLSIIVRKLVKSGYLTKKYPDETGSDKRKVYFHITEEGNEVLHELTEDFLNSTRIFIKNLTPEQLHSFVKGYSALSLLVNNKTIPEGAENDEDILAKDILSKMMSLIGKMGQVYYSVFTAHKGGVFSVQKFGILGLLCKEGFSEIQEITKFTNLSESAVSIALSKLCDAGYAYRQYPNNDEDGRKVYFFATEKGFAELNELNEKLCGFFDNYYNSLNTGEQEILREGIYNLGKAF